MVKFLIVLYNKPLCTCETCSSILNWSKEARSSINELYVWNNSPYFIPSDEKQDFLRYFPETKVSFYEDGINHPLSFVYNEIIKQTDEKGILVLWDHDSNVPEKYVKELLLLVKTHEDINLFLPQILFNEHLVSPGRMFYFWGRTMSEISSGKQSAKNLTAINSGMAIRCNYIKNIFPGYNPKIRFYGTDNDFMYKYRTQNESLYVMSIQLKHELNSFSKTDLGDSILRYRDIKNGIIQLSKGFPFFIRLLSWFYIFIQSTKLNIKNKTTGFWT